MKLLDARLYDMLFFNETHSVQLPIDLQVHASKCGYTRLELPARKFNTAGRFVGGSVVFVKKSFAVSSVSKDYFEWGENISFILN